tara:strand:+ start:410 stop:1453 length:1044 start_codon:yes stop_codon:yes gene_type:complete
MATQPKGVVDNYKGYIDTKYTKETLLNVAKEVSTLQEATIIGGVLPTMCRKKSGFPATDKRPSHFFNIYGSLPLDRNKEYKLLEIGNRWCGSLWGWRVYLPHSKIYGLDIDPATQKYSTNDPDLGIKVYEGDQTDTKLLKQIHKESGGLDVVIDDGGHTMTQINTTFETLWPLLNNGGIYVIEDLQCCYWPSFEGGVKKENSSMEMIKSLFDNIHACYYKKEGTKSKRAEETMSEEPVNYYDRSVASVQMFDSICVITKKVKEDSYGYVTPFTEECMLFQEIINNQPNNPTNEQRLKDLGISTIFTSEERENYKQLIKKVVNKYAVDFSSKEDVNFRNNFFKLYGIK